MTSKTLKNIYVFLSILIVLSAAYSSVLLTLYIHHDDAIYWLNYPTVFNHPYHDFNFFLGRFLGAFFESVFGYFVHSIEHLNIIRFFCVIELSICGLIYFSWMRKNSFNSFNAFLIVIIIFTLPPFQIMASYAGIFYNTTAILLSLCAAFGAGNISTEKSFPKRIFNKSTLLAIMLLISALCFYQSAAMFYWATAALIILFSTPRSLVNPKQQIVNLFGVGLGGVAIYRIMALAIIDPHSRFVANPFHAYSPYMMEKNYMEKMMWFIQEPLVNSLNLWSIFPEKRYAIIVAGFIVFTGIFLLCRTLSSCESTDNKKADVAKRLFYFGVLVCLLLLSFLPNFVSAEHPPFYRSSASLTSLIVILIIGAISCWLSFLFKSAKEVIFTAILFLACVFAIFMTNNNLLYYQAIPGRAELQYLENSLKQANASQCNQIHIIYSNGSDLKCRYDEFATPTTRYFLDTRSLISYFLKKWAQNDGLNIVRLGWVMINNDAAVVECVTAAPADEKTFHTYRMKITHGLKSEKTDFDTAVCVIDMTKLYDPSGELAYLNLKARDPQ